jgi:hypothetical protein
MFERLKGRSSDEESKREFKTRLSEVLSIRYKNFSIELD